MSLPLAPCQSQPDTSGPPCHQPSNQPCRTPPGDSPASGEPGGACPGLPGYAKAGSLPPLQGVCFLPSSPGSVIPTHRNHLPSWRSTWETMPRRYRQTFRQESPPTHRAAPAAQAGQAWGLPAAGMLRGRGRPGPAALRMPPGDEAWPWSTAGPSPLCPPPTPTHPVLCSRACTSHRLQNLCGVTPG